MLANMMLPLFIISPFFFVLAFPIICLTESFIIIKYLNIHYDFDRVFKSIVSTNVISSIISISIIIAIEQVSFVAGHEITYSETISFLNDYKFFAVICLYFTTLLIECLCMRVFFREMKISLPRIFNSVVIANTISHLISVPIFYRYFF